MRLFVEYSRSALLVVAITAPLSAVENNSIALRESAKPGQTIQASITLEAEGDFQPASLPGQTKLESEHRKIASTYVFRERVLDVDQAGFQSVVARWTDRAEASIQNKSRPFKFSTRPEVSLLVARLNDEYIHVSSVSGPLTRAELDLVEAPGDPLGWSDLLPKQKVKVGDTWQVGPIAAKSLSGYDSLAVNFLRGKLESITATEAKIRLQGDVRGAWLGAEGLVKHDGTFTFDRSLQRISKLELGRTEERKPGAVEDGLSVKSKLVVARTNADSPTEMSEETLRRLKDATPKEWDLLLYPDPSGTFMLDHERAWHIFWEDSRRCVLKRLDGGDVSAQLNLVMGSRLAKNQTPDLDRFRLEIERGLGKRFVRFLDKGELVDLGEGRGAMLRAMVEGAQNDVKLVLIYYLMLSPQGDQIVAAFTLQEAAAKTFGDQDLRIMGSLRWTNAGRVDSNR